jgi:hypothetical protein
VRSQRTSNQTRLHANRHCPPPRRFYLRIRATNEEERVRSARQLANCPYKTSNVAPTVACRSAHLLLTASPIRNLRRCDTAVKRNLLRFAVTPQQGCALINLQSREVRKDHLRSSQSFRHRLPGSEATVPGQRCHERSSALAGHLNGHQIRSSLGRGSNRTERLGNVRSLVKSDAKYVRPLSPSLGVSLTVGLTFRSWSQPS